MPKKAYGIYLYWVPLGSGGNFVRLNGKVYEAVAASRRRPRRARSSDAVEQTRL